MSYLSRLCAAALVAAVLPAHAGGIERLQAFVDHTRSAEGTFTQSVYDKAGKAREQTSGTLQFQRPGKFRWEYSKPYKQVIVGDGEKLWIWDADLNQVTARRMSAALGSTPAALLAGSNDLEKSFNLSTAPVRDGQEWVDAMPKDRDSSIQKVRMGFKGDALATMELEDSFGQRTVIRFSKLDKNPKLAADLFTFTPPAGADVVNE